VSQTDRQTDSITNVNGTANTKVIVHAQHVVLTVLSAKQLCCIYVYQPTCDFG